MSVKSEVKKVTNVDGRMVGSVVLGLAVFGALVYAVRSAPRNAVTEPLKKATEIAASA